MNTQSLNIAKACLIGNVCFDSFDSETVLKFFTTGAITQAMMTLKANGLVEDTDYKLTN